MNDRINKYFHASFQHAVSTFVVFRRAYLGWQSQGKLFKNDRNAENACGNGMSLLGLIDYKLFKGFRICSEKVALHVALKWLRNDFLANEMLGSFAQKYVNAWNNDLAAFENKH